MTTSGRARWVRPAAGRRRPGAAPPPRTWRWPPGCGNTPPSLPRCNRTRDEQSRVGSRRDDRSGRPQTASPRGPQQRDPDRTQAAVDPDPRPHRPAVLGAQVAGARGWPAHRVRRGGLPQHLRVLGGPGGHLPHRRRAVHPPLRLLPDRHGQARRPGPRRAAPGRRERRHDGPALLHDHRRGPRRPARRRRLALRRDRPPDPRAEPRHRCRAADPRLQLDRRAARRGLRRPPRGTRAQPGDGAADLQADPPGVPLPALAGGADARRGRPDWSPSRT